MGCSAASTLCGMDAVMVRIGSAAGVTIWASWPRGVWLRITSAVVSRVVTVRIGSSTDWAVSFQVPPAGTSNACRSWVVTVPIGSLTGRVSPLRGGRHQGVVEAAGGNR